MNLYSVYNYFVNIVQPFIMKTDDCLYNAMVRTMGPSAQPTPLSMDALIDIRESARSLIAFIDGEIQARCDEDDEAASAAMEEMRADV